MSFASLSPHRAVCTGRFQRPEVLVRSSEGLARPFDDGDEREGPPLRRREAQAAVVLQRERCDREEQSEEEAEPDTGAGAAGGGATRGAGIGRLRERAPTVGRRRGGLGRVREGGGAQGGLGER